MTRFYKYVTLLWVAGSALVARSEIKDLRGLWNVTLEDTGQHSTILLPGTTDIAHLGNPVDTLSMSVDDKFRRLTRRFSYIGPATYSRIVNITPEMANKPLELSLERVLWKSTAELGGEKSVDTLYSLVSPHRHLFSKGLPVGNHELVVHIDNSKQYDISTGNLAHSYTNDTQTIWNGILGDITLRAIPDADIDRMEIYTVADGDSIKVKAYIVNNTEHSIKRKTSFSINGTEISVSPKIRLNPGMNEIVVTLPVDRLEKWNEFNPRLYTMTASIGKDSSKTTTFGIRTIDNKDGLEINGTPVFLRGTLECCVFPLTGVPPTDKKGWEKTFATAREWGLNHFRFHSWCPPEAAFQVADSLGFYLQVELPVWSLKIGDDPEAEAFLKDEFENIVRNYGNHPSFCLLSIGNELQHDFNWLNNLTEEMKNRDPRHLYTCTSFTFEKGHGGHPEPADEFFVTQWTDNGWVRGQGVFETEKPSFNANYNDRLKDINVPLISHEIGQYAVYPSMEEIGKYTGTLNPLNFKHIKEDLKKKGLLDKSKDMTLASGKLAALMYKEEIERAMKTSGMSGFQLLGLQDFPGQGTALVGLIDAFWDNKGAVSSEWFREFCSPVVPLLHYPSATYRNSENFTADISIANFSSGKISDETVEWSLINLSTGDKVAEGTIETGEIPVGKVESLATFSAPLSSFSQAAAAEIVLKLGDKYKNSWKIHVYPDTVIEADDILLTRSFDEAQQGLKEGKKVLLAPSPDEIEGIESKFLPVFWSPVHFPKQAGTMGIMCEPTHPALSLFPNDGYTDWQWWNPVKNAKVINLDTIGIEDSIVTVIDNFVHNRRLAYIFEAKSGNGNLLFCAFDILNPDNDDPAMNQLKLSLINYMQGSDFTPSEIIYDSKLDSLRKHTEKETTTPTSIYE